MPENTSIEYGESNDPSGLDDEALLSQARQEFSDIILREKQPREEYERCTRFLALEQWNQSLVDTRGWNVPSLVVDQLGPIKSQIVNDWKKNRMGIVIGPGDEVASEETAKIYSGLVRNIEYMSKGVAKCDMGMDHMTGGNQGYIGLMTRRKPGTFKQELFIRGFEDPMAVYLGRFTEIDQSDLYDAFKRDCLSESEFKRQYKDSEYSDFDSWGSGFSDWYNAEKHEVALAEWWHIWFKSRKLLKLPRTILIKRDGRQIALDAVYESELPPDAEQQGLQILDSVDDPERIVMQYLMTGKEILSRTRWLGKNIPIFQFKGRTYYVKGEKRMFSAISPAIDSQAQLNYAESGIAEQMGSTVHVPWVGPVGSFKSRVADWMASAVKRLPYLEYDPVVVRTTSGEVLAPPPQRQRTEAELQSYIQASEHAANNIRFTTGITKSAQGIDDRAAKSGIAKREDAQQSDNSAFDWHASGVQTLSLLGDAIVDVAPKIIPENELIQILDDQEKQTSVLVNADIANNPKTPKGQDASHFLDRGEYRVRVSAAPSNESIRKDTEEKLGRIYTDAPEPQQLVMTGALIRSTDMNGKDEIADLADKAAGVPVKPKDGQPPVPPEAQALIDAGEQFKAQAEAIIESLTAELESKKMELASKEKIASASDQTKLEIERMRQEGAERERQLTENIETLRTEQSRISTLLESMHRQAEMSQQESEAALNRGHEAGLQDQQLTAQQQAAREAAAQEPTA